MLAVAYATGGASHAKEIKGDDPGKKGCTGPRVWGLGVKLTTSPRKNNIVAKPQGNEEEQTLRPRYEAIVKGPRLRTRNIELTL
jgi:hypothetical protein